MTIRDTRFDPFPDAGQWAVTFPMPRRANSVDELYSAWQTDVSLLQSQFGRRLKKDELRTAVPVREI